MTATMPARAGRGGRRREHRFPWEPIGALVTGSAPEKAVRLGVHARQVERWKAEGLTAAAADRAAVAIRLHPANVWPDWYQVTG